MDTELTPLLAANSPLGPSARALVADLFAREQRLMDNLPTDDPRDPARLRRVLLTRSELLGQPTAIATSLTREANAIAAVAAKIAAAPPTQVFLTGCGDSLAVMVGARLLLEQMLGVSCEPVQALDLAYYYTARLLPGTLVIALSSSGATTRTTEAVLIARARGATTLVLSNTPGSPMMLQSDHMLLVHAARLGWPTQSSTAALAVLCDLAVRIGSHLGAAGAAMLAGALAGVPDHVAAVLDAMELPVARIAAAHADRPIYLFAGGGPAYAAAMFGATKVKECSPDHAIAIPLEEFHHYNSQKQGDPLFVLAPRGPSVARARDTAQEGRRWGGHVHAIVTEAETALDHCTDTVLRLPFLPEPLAAFSFTLPLQLFAYHVALEKFRAAGAVVPDRPA